MAPVTYYRYYLPLVPLAALVAAYGLWTSPLARYRFVPALALAWPLFLLADLEQDYLADPRVASRAFYQENAAANYYATYYAVWPRQVRQVALFDPERYLARDMAYLGQGDYLVLSENWYDTAFANEVNGIFVADTDRLIKTRPQYAETYRRILSGSDPNLVQVASYDLRHFMPETWLHDRVYGTFQTFVGDLKIYRIRR